MDDELVCEQGVCTGLLCHAADACPGPVGKLPTRG